MIRYRLYGFHPIKKKWTKFEQASSLKAVAKKVGLNIMMNPKWYYYPDEKGKQVRLRLVCEEVNGKKVRELEEYKLTKGWKVKGYFTNWESMGK